MKFGALVVLGGRVIGRGWNRRLARNEKPPFPVCPWSIHAEQDAIYKALKRRRNLSGAILYVAGLFSDTGEPYVPRRLVSTCHRCRKIRVQYDIRIRIPARIPSGIGWRVPADFFDVHTRLGKKIGSIVSFRRRNNG
jgi:hypothetical protein